MHVNRNKYKSLLDRPPETVLRQYMINTKTASEGMLVQASRLVENRRKGGTSEKRTKNS